jgi:hypothetical protein
MGRKIAALILAVTLLGGMDIADVTDKEAHADASFSFNLFFDSLAPYGRWVPVDGYGYGWYPTQVGAGWQPYANGQWVWSNQGWTWVSYEPWGWATYHYGRWIYDPYHGWLWIPGTVWAPAWVSWYQAPGYVGWSPLPPDNNFFLEIGISFTNYGYGYYGGNRWGYNGYYHHHDNGHYYDNDYYAPGNHCIFVPQNKFTYKNAKLVALDGPDRLTVMRNVRNVTDIKVENNKIYNYGPDKAGIERAEKGKLKRVDIVDRNLTAVRGRQNPNTLNGNRYSVFRPDVRKKEGDTPYSGISGLNNPDIKKGNKSVDRTMGNSFVQDRNTSNRTSIPYGNKAPSDYGVIKRYSMGQRNGANRDAFTGGQSRSDAQVPMNSRGSGDVNSRDANRGNNRYSTPYVVNESRSIKNERTGSQNLRNNYEAPVTQMQPGTRYQTNNQSRYRQPGSRSAGSYSKPGNDSRSLNKSTQQPGHNYNPSRYNTQRYSNQHNSVQKQNKGYSNRKSSGRSGSNRYSNSTSRSHTNPSRSTGSRSYNPGNSQSFNHNSSFVQDSGHGR